MKSFKEHLSSLDAWMNGHRVIHLDDDEVNIESYKKQWKKMEKKFIIESGENIRWQGVKNSMEFRKECADNSLKAVVCDIDIKEPISGIDVVKGLITEGIIHCPVFFVSGTPYESLSDAAKRKITDIRARYIEKTSNQQQLQKDIMEIMGA